MVDFRTLQNTEPIIDLTIEIVYSRMLLQRIDSREEPPALQTVLVEVFRSDVARRHQRHAPDKQLLQ